jgi:hypothetical protein
MTAPTDQLAQICVAETQYWLTTNIGKIKHCLSQLNDRQVWWRPEESMNSIANIMLHLCGNIRQRISATVGGEPDNRDERVTATFCAKHPKGLSGKRWLSPFRRMRPGIAHNDLRRITMKTVSRAQITDLEQIPNIGPSIAANLRHVGILSPQDLLGKDPYKMYDDLCRSTGVRHDPCVIDVFIAAVRFMAGEPKKPWWKYTPERKRTLAARVKRKA